MTNDTNVHIEGMIVQRFKPGKAGKYTVHDFKVKTDNGETFTVRKFFDFDNELIGKRVSLEATVSQYNGKEYYNVAKGTEISVIGDGVATPVATAVASEVVKPRVTRAPKPAPVTATQAVAGANISEDLEDVRSQVEGIITKDVEFCTSLLGAKASKDAIAQLVSAFQATRATLVIQASQRRRGL